MNEFRRLELALRLFRGRLPLRLLGDASRQGTVTRNLALCGSPFRTGILVAGPFLLRDRPRSGS